MLNENEFERLESALVHAGRTIAYPATPPVAALVHATLAAERAARRAPLSPVSRRLAWTLAAALVLALALLLAFPATREAIAQLLGLRTVHIIQVTPTPTPTGAFTPQPTATPGVAPIAQCCAATLEEGRRRATFPILLPADESPSQVFFQDVFGRDFQQVILVFGEPAAPRYVLYEAHLLVYQKLVGYTKTVGPGTVIDVTSVKGREARWLTGEPHVLVTLGANGQPIADLERPVSANTLVWEGSDPANPITYRLETTLGEAEAIRIAESLK